MQKAYIALGSNIQEPITQINVALKELALLPKTRVVSASSLYRNPPFGMLHQPDFINAVAKVTTDLTAVELLDALLMLENQHQRIRVERNGPRTLDLDLLLYEQLLVKTAHLEIPHPRMHERAFVLLPLAEIEPTLVLPCGTSVQQLLENVDTNMLFKLT